jgi:aryl-alcohol dehydrogenase-like predicted oxidoreductase
VTLLDSAEMYPVPQRAETQGRSEEFLGRWLRETGCRSRVVVATKVAGPAGMAWLRDGPLRLDAAAIRAATEASLLRLRCDYVDLLQLHWPDRYVPMFGDVAFDAAADYGDWEPIQMQLAALAELVAEGKARSPCAHTRRASRLTHIPCVRGPVSRCAPSG